MSRAIDIWAKGDEHIRRAQRRGRLYARIAAGDASPDVARCSGIDDINRRSRRLRSRLEHGGRGVAGRR
jgi:hypothetical protein